MPWLYHYTMLRCPLIKNMRANMFTTSRIIQSIWNCQAVQTLDCFLLILKWPFNKIKILWFATTALKESFRLIFSNTHLYSRETVPLRPPPSPYIYPSDPLSYFPLHPILISLFSGFIFWNMKWIQKQHYFAKCQHYFVTKNVHNFWCIFAKFCFVLFYVVKLFNLI